MWIDDFIQATSEAMDDRVRESLYARGVTDEQIATYRLGYVDRKLPDVDYPEPFLKWCFEGKKLDDMYVLPLTNALGEIKGVQFRHVDRERKGYTDFMAEKGESILFGLGQAVAQAWDTKRILLVEGGFDLFPMQRYFPEVVATLTAQVMDALVRILRRLDVSDIWLGYDRDLTGRKTTADVKKFYGKEFRIHSLTFPEVKMIDGKTAKDPSDLWETWGEQAFGECIRPMIKDAGSPMEMW